MTALLGAEADYQASDRVWSRRVDLVLATWGVLAAVLITFDVGGPVRGLVVLGSALLVPGLALLRGLDLLDPWARFCLVIIGSLTIETVVSLVMVWTKTWHPEVAAIVILLVSTVFLLRAPSRTSMTTEPDQTKQASGSEFPSSGPRPGPKHVRTDRSSASWLVLGWALLAGAVALWLISLARTDVSDLGEWGLVTAFPVLWYIGVGLAVGVCVWGLAWQSVPEQLMAAAVATIALMLYASAAVVEAAPRLPWVYKHIAVTRYIELHGSVDPSIDIYNRWPGFFSFTAYLGEITGYTNPVNYAGWAEPIFMIFDIILVVAIARTISRNAHWYWTAAMIFTLSNWVGQVYFSPQAFAFALYLGICLLVLTYLRRDPRRLGRSIEWVIARITRASANRTDELGRGASVPPTRIVAAVAAILAIQVVVVCSHQLTPYLAVFALLPLFILGYFRPVWISVALVAITILYLVPNYDYIQSHFGLFSGFDPIANATYTPVVHVNIIQASVWQARGTQILTGLTWLIALLGLARRGRNGDARTVLIVSWLAIAPALSLVAQTYGGEGRLRVILFSLPWCAMAGAWLIWPSRRAIARVRSTIICAVVFTAFTIVFVVTYFQPEADDQMPRSAVVAAEWLDGQAERGDIVIQTAPPFPALIGPHYNLYAKQVNLGDYNPYYEANLTPEDLEVISGQLSTSPHRTFIVFSDATNRYVDVHGIFTPGEIGGLENQISHDKDFVKVYASSSTRIYRFELN